MADLDITKAIPAEKISLISGFDRPGVTDPSKLILGDPYIKFSSDGKEYYTRNFNHSKLIPSEKKYLRFAKMYISTVGETFLMPIIEKSAVDSGKLVGYVNGHVEVETDSGKNKLQINKIEITHNPRSEKIPTYGNTFATDKKSQGLKTNIGRNLLTQAVAKLPFVEDVGGYRISGARDVAVKQRIEEGKRGKSSDKAHMKVGSNIINRIKQNLAKTGVIDGFFTQIDLSKEKIENWMKKNSTATAGVALSGNDPMQSLGIKGMGSPTDDAANYYLALAEGGFVDGDEFGDMIDFVMENTTPRGNLIGINQLTRPLSMMNA